MALEESCVRDESMLLYKGISARKNIHNLTKNTTENLLVLAGRVYIDIIF